MMNIKKLKRGQKGLTLIELVIVIGLTSIVVAAITGTILGVFNTDARTRNDMTAVYQVRHAGKLVSEDILQAQHVTPGASSGFPLSLNWTEVGETPNTYKVIYKLVDMSGGPGGLKILWREYYLNSALNSTTKVAEYINPDPTKTSIDPSEPCSYPNCGAYTFTVTATVGGVSETRVYQVTPRPGS